MSRTSVSLWIDPSRVCVHATRSAALTGQVEAGPSRVARISRASASTASVSSTRRRDLIRLVSARLKTFGMVGADPGPFACTTFSPGGLAASFRYAGGATASGANVGQGSRGLILRAHEIPYGDRRSLRGRAYGIS